MQQGTTSIGSLRIFQKRRPQHDNKKIVDQVPIFTKRSMKHKTIAGHEIEVLKLGRHSCHTKEVYESKTNWIPQTMRRGQWFSPCPCKRKQLPCRSKVQTCRLGSNHNKRAHNIRGGSIHQKNSVPNKKEDPVQGKEPQGSLEN